MSEEKDPTKVNGFYDWMIDTWKRFNMFSAIEEDDSILLIIGKIIFRIVGIIFMILLSPFLLIGMLLAFMVVM